MKLYEKTFILIGIFALLVIISVVVFSAKAMTDMGLHVRDYNVNVTDQNWPFTFERKGSFTRLYNRASGFQDTIYFIAVSGNNKDIEWLGDKIRQTVTWNDGSPSEKISGINENIKIFDSDYLRHGWDIDPQGISKWCVKDGGHVCVFINNSGDRLYYHSYTE